MTLAASANSKDHFKSLLEIKITMIEEKDNKIVSALAKLQTSLYFLSHNRSAYCHFDS